MRVCIAPYYQGQDRGDGGIRRVVEAQQKYLPQFGWDVTDNPDAADLIGCHGATLVERPGVPLVAQCHGLIWEDYDFGAWGEDVNRHVIDVLTRADAITAPSQWVAHAITRGMLAAPTVIHHGIDADAWAHDGEHGGYVLWNKARIDPVSDPSDMQALAAMLPEVPFVSTFGRVTENVTITGMGTYEQMRPIVQRAGVYLATARETFGIGTLEALASGVPVVGWAYGGQAEIVRNGETGILVPFGDLDALADAVRRLLADRERYSRAAAEDARARWGWEGKIRQYAALYDRVLAAHRAPRPKVSVIVTTYNLARYLADALASVAAQTLTDHETIVIDDCGADGAAVERLCAHHHAAYHRTPENVGLAGARNYGFQQARGRYILFLDADDMLDPNALDTLATALDRDRGIHIAYGSLDLVDTDGAQRRRNPWPAGAFSWHAQIAHLNQLHGACLMRRAVLERSGGYRRRDWRAEDAAFWARVTSLGFRAQKVTEDTIQIYRMHPDQKSRGEDGDGDWTAWLPWRLAGDPYAGVQAMRQGAQPNARIVPFGAQGQPPAPHKAWPVRHYAHPVVAVVIPVGPGHEEVLIDALDSVQAQTMPEWEAIVVNDTGGALDLAGHPWARVVDAGGIGAGAARNRGVGAAAAPFTVFLDADDVLLPRALELMLAAHAEHGGYVYGDWLTLADERRIDGEMTRHDVTAYDQRRMLAGLLHAVTALVPTDWARAVGGFDETLPVFEDWDFYCRLAANGFCGRRVAEPLLIYRRATGKRTRAALKDRAAGEAMAYTPLGEAAAQAIIDRLAPWTSGEEAIRMCCGNNPATATAAANALGDLAAFALGGPAPASVAPEARGVQTVRMEFIGAQEGARTLYGKGSKLPYRAGREPGARFHDVDPRDVEHFLDLGLFRVVATIENTVEERAAAAVEPRVDVSRVKGRKR